MLSGGPPAALDRVALNGAHVAGWRTEVTRCDSASISGRRAPSSPAAIAATTRSSASRTTRATPSTAFPRWSPNSDGELRFGFDAERVAAEPDWTVLRSFKRLLNDPSPERPSRSGRHTSSAMVELLAALPRRARARPSSHRSNLAERCSAKANRSRPSSPLRPTRTARSASSRLDAFRRAGFEVLGDAQRASAAGFEYTHRYRNTLTSKQRSRRRLRPRRGHLRRLAGAHDRPLPRGHRHRRDQPARRRRLRRRARRSGAREGRSSRRASLPSARPLLAEQCREAKERLQPELAQRIIIDLAACARRRAQSPRSRSRSPTSTMPACRSSSERIDAMMRRASSGRRART